VAGISMTDALKRGLARRFPLRGDAKRHGGRLLAPEAPPREQAMAKTSPRRSQLWPFVAYGALALAMLATPERPTAAKGRPETDCASATPRVSPDTEREIDRSRAAERGRGRQATSPLRIPWRGWKDILWRAYEKMNDNRLLAVAAGVVFYALLGLFPAVTAFVSLYGLIADASAIDRHLSLAAGIMPSGAVDILHEQLTRLTSSGASALSFGFVFGLLFALWSANSGTKAVLDGLNVAAEETEKRSFIRLNLISLGFTFGAFAALTLAIGAVVVAPILLAHLGLGGVADTLIRILRWPALLALVVVGLAILYRYGPSRREARWTWLSVGSVAAAVSWLVTSTLFSWYIANFGAYDATYGSLGAAIGMMMWMWISMIVILLGAQLNAEIEHQTSKDSTVGPEEPLGRRGAVKADTIGAAQN
jgi:membrane protein